MSNRRRPASNDRVHLLEGRPASPEQARRASPAVSHLEGGKGRSAVNCNRPHGPAHLGLLSDHGARLTPRPAWAGRLKPLSTPNPAESSNSSRERSLATLAPPGSDTSSDPDGDSGATSAVDNDDDDADSPLRPDLYCLDHDRCVIYPIEFTVADDANLGAAFGRKHAKYDPLLLRNPCASAARLVPGARDPHTWTFDPLVVVAVGV